jgi:hypothetical protein
MAAAAENPDYPAPGWMVLFGLVVRVLYIVVAYPYASTPPTAPDNAMN